jgi:hypothetical protein
MNKLAWLLVVVISACWTAQPYMTVRAAVSPVVQVDHPSIAEAGVTVHLDSRCRASMLDHWCTAVEPNCRPNPITSREEDAACPPGDAGRVALRLHAPWGSDYDGSGSPGQDVLIPVDWQQSNLDPLAATTRDTLATGWAVAAGAGSNVAFELVGAQLESALEAIGKATATEYSVGPKSDVATLAVSFADAGVLVAGQPSSVKVTVGNAGPKAAYRVIVILRSSIPQLDKLQISFGRIEPNTTETRSHTLNLPPGVDDPAPMVVATVSAYNASPADARHRFKIVDRGSFKLALTCTAASSDVVQGDRLKLDCHLKNTGEASATGLTYTISIAGAAQPATGPKQIDANGDLAFSLAAEISESLKPDPGVPISVVAKSGSERVESALSIRVTSARADCPSGKLTRDAYLAKRKQLQAAVGTGSLNQDEFDRYDARLVACLE